MPKGWYRCQVSIPADSGIPRDAVNNVWAFSHDDDAANISVDGPAIATRLDGFYTALVNLWSSQQNWAGTTLKIFNLGETPPRVPAYEAAMPITTEVSANADLPPEVAVCLSFKGVPVSGANARRRRGRVYLGPVQVTGSSDRHVIEAGWITLIMAAIDSNIAVGGPLAWCIYSPYTHHAVPVGRDIGEVDGSGEPLFPENPALLPQAFVPVYQYWMDNEWDTQRRRGTKATTRTTAVA